MKEKKLTEKLLTAKFAKEARRSQRKDLGVKIFHFPHSWSKQSPRNACPKLYARMIALDVQNYRGALSYEPRSERQKLVAINPVPRSLIDTPPPEE
jgi:hypothetical protein